MAILRAIAVFAVIYGLGVPTGCTRQTRATARGAQALRFDLEQTIHRWFMEQVSGHGRHAVDHSQIAEKARRLARAKEGIADLMGVNPSRFRSRLCKCEHNGSSQRLSQRNQVCGLRSSGLPSR